MCKVVKQVKEVVYENLPSAKQAVIFQGGGAIGAYAAGVYAVLYYCIKKDMKTDENIFDIVAGASAGTLRSNCK